MKLNYGENRPHHYIHVSNPVHVLEKETVYMKNNMDKIHCSYEIKKLKKTEITSIIIIYLWKIYL